MSESAEVLLWEMANGLPHVLAFFGSHREGAGSEKAAGYELLLMEAAEGGDLFSQIRAGGLPETGKHAEAGLLLELREARQMAGV